MDQIRSMISLTMMGLTPVPLARALFLFALMNPLVVSVAWSMAFFLTGIESIGDFIPVVLFVPRGVESKGGRLMEIFWRPKF